MLCLLDKNEEKVYLWPLILSSFLFSVTNAIATTSVGQIGNLWFAEREKNTYFTGCAILAALGLIFGLTTSYAFAHAKEDEYHNFTDGTRFLMDIFLLQNSIATVIVVFFIILIREKPS